VQERQQTPLAVQRQQQGQSLQLDDNTCYRSWRTPVETLIALALKHMPGDELLREDMETRLRIFFADIAAHADKLQDEDVEFARILLETKLQDMAARTEAINFSVAWLKLGLGREPHTIPAFRDMREDDDARDAVWITLGIVALGLQGAHNSDKIVLSLTKPEKAPAAPKRARTKPKRTLRGLLAGGLRKATARKKR
jgi:hypothetical protein